MNNRIYEKVILYYFSGTGNARNVANWIAEIAMQKGISVEITDISKIDRKHVEQPVKNALIGFCSPTHGFNFPPIILNFLLRFPKSDNNAAFIINTRAGMKLNKIFVPGLSGIAQLFALFVLLFKGYKIIGMRPIDLPSNWISLHPGLKTKVVESMTEHCKRISEQFAEKIFSGKRDYRALFDLIQDLLISPVSIGYYFVGRFFFAKTFIASRDCNLCGICIKSCPLQAIKEIDKRPFWTYSCESCMKCMNACPERAIQTAHGFIIGFSFLVFTFGLEYFFRFTIDKLASAGTIPLLENSDFRFTIGSFLAIPVLFASYRIVHYLMRFSFFERLIIYTSLTSYKFWRRYRAVKF
jgi:ferredoxin